ncbi:FecR family protein [Novosphingobium rosa]|uniref:FecR family protein n=1 Tax=Novosphingobium rosa TaxID=76978 RepID=UPI00082E3832|nr:FecR domain-containing protein [Novosphingobium rosa]
MTGSVETSSSTVEAAAARWAAALDANPDTTPEGLEAWLAQNPRHAGALLRAQATLALFTPSVQLVPDAGPAPQPTRRDRAQGWMRRHQRWLAGGAALTAAGVAAVLLYAPGTDRYATGTGEMRQVTLAEGSSLSLDTQTRLKVTMESDARVVRLEEGRTLLRVRHDASRPFLVKAGAITITDIGTVFQVVRRGDAVTVLVSEGMVEVGTPGGTLRLGAGQSASFDGHGEPVAQALSPAAIERATAWTSGRIELDGERLDSAIDEMNRHNQLKITLGNAALGGEKLYGSFRLDDPEGFARTAALSVGAQARDQGDTIRIIK